MNSGVASGSGTDSNPYTDSASKSPVVQSHVCCWTEKVRLCLQERGLSSTSAEKIISSIRNSTVKQYTVYINKFHNFHGDNVLDSTDVTVINFLESLYQAGHGYSVINVACSAIKTYLELLGVELPFDLIARFKKGVFNSRPSLPRYSEIWDPEIVLSYFKKNASCVDLPFVTLKCVTLLALATSQRVSSLHSLLFSDVILSAGNAVIVFNTLHKQSRPGSHLGHLTLEAFDDQDLCIVATLKLYISLVASIRLHQPNLTALFITHGKPYRNAAKDTLSRWIKQTIHNAGVPQHFTAHSTRSASTSAMFLRGVNVSDIMKKAGWSCSSTFHRFYNKTVT